MVSEGAEYAVGRTKARERLHHFTLPRGVPAEVVPGHNDQVRFLLIGHGDASANLRCGHERTDMYIGKLGYAKTFERLRQARQPDARVSKFHVESAVQKPVSRGHERCGAYRDCYLPENVPATEQGQVIGIRIGSGGMIYSAIVDVVIEPHCAARSSVCR